MLPVSLSLIIKPLTSSWEPTFVTSSNLVCSQNPTSKYCPHMTVGTESAVCGLSEGTAQPQDNWVGQSGDGVSLSFHPHIQHLWVPRQRRERERAGQREGRCDRVVLKCSLGVYAPFALSLFNQFCFPSRRNLVRLEPFSPFFGSGPHGPLSRAIPRAMVMQAHQR